ncbi:hypothetical protein RW26_01760 [Aeromonas sp. L_1B5_3]|nr:hypothetical protein RW26_01760 [Aeromonas sp. L_1B5_3]
MCEWDSHKKCEEGGKKQDLGEGPAEQCRDESEERREEERVMTSPNIRLVQLKAIVYLIG